MARSGYTARRDAGDMNTTTRTRAAAAIAAAALIAPLAGCAGTAQVADLPVPERSFSDVAERRLWMTEPSRARTVDPTDVAERRLRLDGATSTGTGSTDLLGRPDVAERRLLMSD